MSYTGFDWDEGNAMKGENSPISARTSTAWPTVCKV